MAALRSMSARISPNLELHRIVVELGRFNEPPIVRLEGRVIGKDPRVTHASEATIVTRYLGPNGEAWINAMREAFSGEVEGKPAADAGAARQGTRKVKGTD